MPKTENTNSQPQIIVTSRVSRWHTRATGILGYTGTPDDSGTLVPRPTSPQIHTPLVYRYTGEKAGLYHTCGKMNPPLRRISVPIFSTKNWGDKQTDTTRMVVFERFSGLETFHRHVVRRWVDVVVLSIHISYIRDLSGFFWLWMFRKAFFFRYWYPLGSEDEHCCHTAPKTKLQKKASKQTSRCPLYTVPVVSTIPFPH